MRADAQALDDEPVVVPSDRAAYQRKLSFLVMATAGLCEMTSPLGDGELDNLVRRSHGQLLDMLIRHRRVSGGP